MKDKKMALSIIVLIIALIMGGVLAYGYYQKATYKLQRPVVSMEIENYGTIKMELYPEEAPNTVENFIKLINEGYYNGMTFQSIEESLVRTGMNNGEIAKLNINGEFSENGYTNMLKFERGTVGLAREEYDNTYYAWIYPTLIEEAYNSGYARILYSYTRYGRI